eukprot:Hpha_TRINITY_DN11905_c0_g1::TRINITY_DN11905_c0_g1_i8::g.20756::m.20756
MQGKKKAKRDVVTPQQPEELVSFPADRRFWQELVHHVRQYPGAQRAPHYHIDCEHLDQAMLVNRAFLRRFVAGWERRNPHIVTRSTVQGDRTWHASQEFWGNGGRLWDEDPSAGLTPDQEWQQERQQQAAAYYAKHPAPFAPSPSPAPGPDAQYQPPYQQPPPFQQHPQYPAQPQYESGPPPHQQHYQHVVL